MHQNLLVADEDEMVFIMIIAIMEVFSHKNWVGFGVGVDVEKANLTTSDSRLPI